MPEIEPQHSLSIVVAPERTPEEEAKGLFGGRGSEPPIVKKIPVEQLRDQFNALSQDVAKLMDDPPASEAGDLHLTELAVQIEITASGGINLIGTASVGATAAMTLTFSR
jgi:hypothetical protein